MTDFNSENENNKQNDSDPPDEELKSYMNVRPSESRVAPYIQDRNQDKDEEDELRSK